MCTCVCVPSCRRKLVGIYHSRHVEHKERIHPKKGDPPLLLSIFLFFLLLAISLLNFLHPGFDHRAWNGRGGAEKHVRADGYQLQTTNARVNHYYNYNTTSFFFSNKREEIRALAFGVTQSNVIRLVAPVNGIRDFCKRIRRTPLVFSPLPRLPLCFPSPLVHPEPIKREESFCHSRIWTWGRTLSRA